MGGNQGMGKGLLPNRLPLPLERAGPGMRAGTGSVFTPGNWNYYKTSESTLRLSAGKRTRNLTTVSQSMPRFAILTHDHPQLHWDLLLEQESGLRTWRLPYSADTPGPISVLSLADHRKLYLDYEGPVSNNRGHVTRWDGGEMEWLQLSPECIRARLHGQRLKGEIVLQASSDPSVWEFTCVPEQASKL